MNQDGSEKELGQNLEEIENIRHPPDTGFALASRSRMRKGSGNS